MDPKTDPYEWRWEEHRSAELIRRYITFSPKLMPMTAFERHAVMSQNRRYEPLFARAFPEVVKACGFTLPSKFEAVANYKGVSKYSMVSDKWDDYNLGPIKAWLVRRYAGKCKTKALATEDEVFQEMDKTTSLGCPMNKKFRDKVIWGQTQRKRDMREFRKRIDESAVGECLFVFNSFSKNEALITRKILADELRQISGADSRGNIELGVYSKGFNDKYVGDYVTGWSRAGVPIQHGGWHWLYTKHVRGGKFKHAIEIDIKKHDATMARVLMLLIWYLRVCAGPKLSRAQKVRWYKLVLAVIDAFIILPDGVVIRKSGGNCSGNFNTLVDNGLITEIYLLVAWIELSGAHGLSTADIDEFMEASIVGDDVLVTLDEVIMQWFTPQAIVKVLADFGVQAEARKVLLADAQFLSHKFQFYQMRRTVVPYPVNCHKAVANVLQPPAEYLDPSPNFPMLLARCLAQRNRFFADANDQVQSYWVLFDAVADLYRQRAKEQSSVYPQEYATAMSLDVPDWEVAELYCPIMEGSPASESSNLALSKAMCEAGAPRLALHAVDW